MMAPGNPPDVARFASFTVGDWLVDPKACLVSRGQTTEKLRPQLAELLLCLARRPGQIVLKEEILAEVWPGQFIAESGLSRCVAELRQLLQDDAQQPRFIETIPKRGYRLIAPVAWLDEAPSPEADAAATEAAPLAAGSARPTAPHAPPPLGRTPRIWAAAGLAVVVGVVAAAIFLGTRQAAGVLTERDTVLLADVSNATRDAVFDDALRLALAVHLEQAPFLRILPREAVRSALARAGRSPDERVVGPLALEICRREGAAVLLAGSIASLGSRYAVGVEATACGSGESVGHALVEANSRERVLGALEQAASRIRQRLGESRDSLRRHDVPLVRATTASLEALRVLTLGDLRRDKGLHAEALPYYRQATELDPQFALAWARRGLTARNVDLREEAIPALRRAFELRERVSQPERFFIEGLYYRFVEGDPFKAIEIFRAWKRMYPGSAIPPNYIAATFSDELGQYEAAVEEAREAVRLAPNTSWPYNNLVQACMGARRFAEVKTAVAEAASRGLDDWSMHAYLLVAALLERDGPAIERETRWSARDQSTAVLWLRVRYAWAMAGGRLGEARRLGQEALTKAGETGVATVVGAVQIDRAEAEALVGDPNAVRGLVEAAITADARAIFMARGAIALALAGDTARARALVDAAARQADTDPAPMKIWLPVAEAFIAARQGRPDDALRILQPVARFERGNDFFLFPLGVRALACAAARRPAEAAAAFEDMLQLRGVVGPNPWDPVAHLGLARALRDSGDTARSLAAYDAFLASWRDADPGLPLLKLAQSERQRLATR